MSGGHEHVSKSQRRRLRKLEKSERRNRKQNRLVQNVVDIKSAAKPKKVLEPLRPKNEAQGHYMQAIRSKTLTISTGPAGTGKTYVSTAMAADMLRDGIIEKLIITRPVIEAGESIGHLPGDIDDKFEPFVASFWNALHDRLGKSQTEYLIKNGVIQAIPLNFMRGRTFDDAWIILDEAQNATEKQMKMLLTRVGMNSKVIVNGDITQTDLDEASGLHDVMNRFSQSATVGFAHFEMEDCVRSNFVRQVLEAYS